MNEEFITCAIIQLCCSVTSCFHGGRGCGRGLIWQAITLDGLTAIENRAKGYRNGQKARVKLKKCYSGCVEIGN